MILTRSGSNVELALRGVPKTNAQHQADYRARQKRQEQTIEDLHRQLEAEHAENARLQTMLEQYTGAFWSVRKILAGSRSIKHDADAYRAVVKSIESLVEALVSATIGRSR